MSSYDDFLNLPFEVQRGFVEQFKKVIDCAIDCGTHYDVFGESMTCQQFQVIKNIVQVFDNAEKKK